MMKSLVIASNSSGGGKTTITLGIMKALIKRGFEVQGYKVGPDYIDTAFHSHITGKAARNLDVFLMEEDGVKTSYYSGKGDYGVIEGVMGLYDGKGIDTYGSTAHVAKLLKVPIILVLSPKAQVATLCAEIKGLMEYENADIKGIILNNINEGYYTLLKYAIEENCGVKVLGYIPMDERLKIGSRHLGLVQSSEIEDVDEKIEICSCLLEKYVDMDRFLKLFKEELDSEKEVYSKLFSIRGGNSLSDVYPNVASRRLLSGEDISSSTTIYDSIYSNTLSDVEEEINEYQHGTNEDKLLKIGTERYRDVDNFSQHAPKKKIRIAVAKDKAFNFYYTENIELLQELGQVIYFSPLENKELPENIDFLYIGGGYPEVFVDKLSSNVTMLNSIREALDTGLRCYAECGGLMYLTEYIEGRKVVGFFNGQAEMTKSLQNFGYAEITVNKENNILPMGLKIRCHEFHKSKINTQEETIYKLTKTSYLDEEKSWTCGYCKKNTVAAYAHIHFFSNLDFLKYIIGI